MTDHLPGISTPEWFPRFFHHAGMAMILTNQQLTRLHANGKFRQLFGYDECLIDKCCSRLRHGAVLADAFLRAMEGGGDDWFDIELNAEDTETNRYQALVSVLSHQSIDDTWFLVQFQPLERLHDPSTPLQRVLSTVDLLQSSITNPLGESKQGEEAQPERVIHVTENERLRHSEEQYRFLAENILDVIWVFDVQSLKFRYVSPSVYKLRGYTSEEVQAQSLEEALTPHSVKKILSVLPLRIKEYTETGKSTEYIDEIEQLCKDGSTVWTEVVAYLKVNEQNGRLEVIGTTRDITDRRRADKARKELEERYRTLTEVTNEGIIIHRNGLVVDLNPSMLRLLRSNADSKDLVGKKVFEFIHHDDLHVVKGRIASSWGGNYEVRIRRLDGTWFNAELFVRQSNINGVPHRVVSVTDITERKIAEDKLVESELRFRRIFDNSIAGMVLCDVNGKIQVVNRAFELLLGHERSFFIGKRIYDFTSPDDVLHERLRINEALKSSSDHLRFEKKMMHRSGKTVWVDMSMSFIRDMEGGLLSQVAVINDINDKKNYELELLKALNYNKTVNHTSPVGIVTTDEKGAVVFANKKAQEIFELKKIDLVGKPLFVGYYKVFDLEGKAFKREMLPFYTVKRSQESLYAQTLSIDTPGHGKKVLSVNTSPFFDESAKFIGVVMTLDDITEKINLEKELRQSNAKLRELNVTKDKFFSIIAHDLRGPVGNIANLSELLHVSFAEQSPELNQQLIKTIYDNATKTFDLLANLLSWSYSQRNAISINIQKLDAAAIIDNSLEVIEGIARKKGIVLVRNVYEGVMVLGDKDMVGTVMRNLASNAVKYSYNNSQIEVGVRLSLQYHGYAEFFLEDNGIGIHAQTLQRLFTTELDVSMAGTQGEEGTGLGLVLCREFVEKQNGKIWADSTPGKGSRFTFTLPLA